MVEHPILLRGLGRLQANGAPMILERTDQALLPVLLAELKRPDALATLAHTVAATRTRNGLLKLFQPVQRLFYIALFEAVCDTFGQPRLDPAVIESAGLVVRRMSPHGDWQGWMQAEAKLRGWVHLHAAEEDQDPDPGHRRQPVAGHPLIDQALTLRQTLTAPLAEATTTLFVAPPEVCLALGKTILYGLVPVTSVEFSDSPDNTSNQAIIVDPDDYLKKIAGHMPLYLNAGDPPPLPFAGGTLTSASITPEQLQSQPNLSEFIRSVRQIAVEFDAFGANAEARALLAALNQLPLPLPNGTSIGSGSFFQKARDVLLDDSRENLTMPVTWPRFEATQIQHIVQLVTGILSKRLIASAQGERRFEQPAAHYALRGFVRVKRKPNCPPHLFWSVYSEPYQIAAWYEAADNGLPLPQIALPDPFDRNSLSQLKPNVAFKVPERLFGLLNKMDPAQVMDGKKPDNGNGFGLDWICSFSIPIITICAFIVLNIFLSLFDIIFQWLLYIKLCIPIPKKP